MTNKVCVSDLENIKSYFLENFGGTYPAGLDYAINMINSGDAVQYTLGYQDGFLEGKKICESPRGEWIKEKSLEGMFRCSVCGRRVEDLTDDLRIHAGLEDSTIADIYPFCHCGADMRKGGAE